MYGLKYYIEFVSDNGLFYRTEIHELNFSGAAQLIEQGEDPVKLDSPTANNNLDALRGSSLKLSLLATEFFTLDDLFTDSEKKFIVIHKQDDNIIFRGYIIPDGANQSFVTDVWSVEVDAIDGIGLLKDLAFVDEAGLFFDGLLSVKDVIFYCLRRVGIPEMNLLTSVNTYHATADLNSDILIQTFQNAERYIKDAAGEHTPMNCEEVLKSTLEIFGACIAQRAGDWIIYKPNELFFNDNVDFYKYDGLSGEPASTVTINLAVNLGSQINGAYPHHAKENQRILLQKAYKMFRVNYKYGLLGSLTPNQNFRNWVNSEPVGWDIVGAPLASQHERGLIITGIANINNYVVNEQPLDLLAGAIVTVEITNGATTQKSRAFFQIKAGNVYLQNNLTWGSEAEVLNSAFALPGGTAFSSLTTPPLPANASLEVRLLAGLPVDGSTYALYERVKTIPVKGSALPGIGEFHTVEQIYDYSYIPENKVVYNGDNDDETDVYVGSLYDVNGDFTANWIRKNATTPDEPKPLLQIMAEDYMRMHRRQYKKFTGGVYGFFNYISVVKISALPGLFMPVNMEFSFIRNTGDFTLLEIMNDEIEGYDPTPNDEVTLLLPGTTYKLTDDYGTPIKPLIR